MIKALPVLSRVSSCPCHWGNRSLTVSALSFLLASCILGSTWPYLPSPLCCYLPCLATLLPGYLRSGRKKGDLCFFGCGTLK